MSALDAVDGSSARHVSAMDVGLVKAPTIRRSHSCKRSRQSVSTSPSRSSRYMAASRVDAMAASVQNSMANVSVGSVEKRIVAQHRANEASKRLRSIPGIGIIGDRHYGYHYGPEGVPVGAAAGRSAVSVLNWPGQAAYGPRQVSH